jgi:hypothetical protein
MIVWLWAIQGEIRKYHQTFVGGEKVKEKRENKAKYHIIRCTMHKEQDRANNDESAIK